MRARTNISRKERQQLQLSDFKGVDFSSSPLRVQANRASDMANFINEYGVNRKRNGWKQLFPKLEGRINGIFPYKDGDYEAILVHAGNKIYRCYEKTPNDEISRIAVNLSTGLNLKDQRSQAFYKNGNLYIIGCGDYLVYSGKEDALNKVYNLERVYNHPSTYIPTTTISIYPKGTEDPQRATLDNPNRLSSKRINTCVGKEGVGENTPLIWELDAGIKYKSLVEIKVETLVNVNEKETHIIRYLNNYDQDKKEVNNNLYYNKSTKIDENGEEVSYTETYEDKNNISGKWGSLLWGSEKKKGTFLLKKDVTPPVADTANISVCFEFVGANDNATESLAETITDCSFGVLFGADGNTDHLFLSGNKNFPNVDFHSADKGAFIGDFTYFPVINTTVIGNDQSEVKGYLRLSDSSLAIYKSDGSHDANIFYRTGSTQNTFSDDGTLTSSVDVFKVSAGAVGEGAVSRYAFANFENDNIFLSKNGVFGTVVSQNVMTTDRYVRERSRSINEKLTRHKDLSEAAGIVYKNRYYLAVDGVCYVADARHKYVASDDVDGSFNYEWWFWDNIPARVWAIVDNELWFGTEDGRICAFDGEYRDRIVESYESASISLNIARDCIECSQHKSEQSNNDPAGCQYKEIFSENDCIQFKEPIYSVYLSDFKVVDNRIFVNNEDQMVDIHDGDEVYADEKEKLIVGGNNILWGLCGLSANTPYYVRDIDRGDGSFSLSDSPVSEDRKTIVNSNFKLCQCLQGKPLFVTNVEKETFQLKSRRSAEDCLKLTNYFGEVPDTISATVTHNSNVVAKWYTPIFDLGTNESSKSLLKMTISTEAQVNGNISFGYETRAARKMLDAKGINVFSFENLSFENFSFDTAFASSYSVKVNERKFNFIIFRFVSDNDSGCAVNNFTAVYKINSKNKGVR